MGGHLRASYPKPQYDRYLEFCGFTDDEAEVLSLNRRGKSNTEIWMSMGLSSSSLDRRIASIKRKIALCDQYDRQFIN